MPEFVSPEDIDGDGTDTETETAAEPDLPTVTISGEEVPFTVAVESMASMMDNPEAFGFTTEGDHIETRNEIKELRDRVEQQEKAIAELAEVVENLGRYQAELASSAYGSTVQLDASALGDIYTTTLFQGLNAEISEGDS